VYVVGAHWWHTVGFDLDLGIDLDLDLAVLLHAFLPPHLAEAAAPATIPASRRQNGARWVPHNGSTVHAGDIWVWAWHVRSV
jgi:hypothetical protein